MSPAYAQGGLTASTRLCRKELRSFWGPDNNRVWKPQNLDEAKAQRVEIGAKVALFGDLTIVLHHTYTSVG